MTTLQQLALLVWSEHFLVNVLANNQAYGLVNTFEARCRHRCNFQNPGQVLQQILARSPGGLAGTALGGRSLSAGNKALNLPLLLRLAMYRAADHPSWVRVRKRKAEVETVLRSAAITALYARRQRRREQGADNANGGDPAEAEDEEDDSDASDASDAVEEDDGREQLGAFAFASRGREGGDASRNAEARRIQRLLDK